MQDQSSSKGQSWQAEGLGKRTGSEWYTGANTEKEGCKQEASESENSCRRGIKEVQRVGVGAGA